LIISSNKIKISYKSRYYLKHSPLKIKWNGKRFSDPVTYVYLFLLITDTFHLIPFNKIHKLSNNYARNGVSKRAEGATKTGSENGERARHAKREIARAKQGGRRRAS